MKPAPRLLEHPDSLISRQVSRGQGVFARAEHGQRNKVTSETEHSFGTVAGLRRSLARLLDHPDSLFSRQVSRGQGALARAEHGQRNKVTSETEHSSGM